MTPWLASPRPQQGTGRPTPNRLQPAAANRLLKRLRKVGQQEAERRGIAPEIMLRKKVLEAMVRTGYPNGPYRLPEELTGWRRALLGDALLNAANNALEVAE